MQNSFQLDLSIRNSVAFVILRCSLMVIHLYSRNSNRKSLQLNKLSLSQHCYEVFRFVTYYSSRNVYILAFNVNIGTMNNGCFMTILSK